MDTTQSWKATHQATLRDPVSGETLRDPDSGKVLDDVPVMMIDDRKAYQEHEWESGAHMGDPDLMKASDGAWTYRIDRVLAKFEPTSADPLLWACDQIWKRAQREGAIVTYKARLPHDEAGCFHAREDEEREPLIVIRHPHAIDRLNASRNRNNGTVLTDDEMREELEVLAHEYGHFQSWKRARDEGGSERVRWQTYNGVVRRLDARTDALADSEGTPIPVERLRAMYKAMLSDKDRELILDEETRAWRHGREILDSLKYQGLDHYDAEAETGVTIYRYRLGMVELEDVPEHARGKTSP
jgi:uncharacterized phage-associated protein